VNDPIPDVPAERLRERALSRDQPALGGWLSVPSVHFLRALSASALDYVGIDCQHSVISEAEAAQLIAAAGRPRSGRLIRVSANRPDLIGRALDGGADGIIVPTVNNAAEARAAVAATRYPPDGVRSFGPVAEFLSRDPGDLVRHVLLLAMIETADGLASVKEILAVPGIDGVYVGPADLGLALGHGAGQFPASPELEPALRTIAQAGQSVGKVAGIHAGSEQFVERYTSLGFGLQTLGVDRSFVAEGVKRALERARSSSSAVPSAASPY
jgi:2-dehydro-3-deoxyglucarate aldolase